MFRGNIRDEEQSFGLCGVFFGGKGGGYMCVYACVRVYACAYLKLSPGS